MELFDFPSPSLRGAAPPRVLQNIRLLKFLGDITRLDGDPYLPLGADVALPVLTAAYEPEGKNAVEEILLFRGSPEQIRNYAGNSPLAIGIKKKSAAVDAILEHIIDGPGPMSTPLNLRRQILAGASISGVTPLMLAAHAGDKSWVTRIRHGLEKLGCQHTVKQRVAFFKLAAGETLKDVDACEIAQRAGYPDVAELLI